MMSDVVFDAAPCGEIKVGQPSGQPWWPDLVTRCQPGEHLVSSVPMPDGNRAITPTRNALYSIFQPLRDFDSLLIFRYILVAEVIDFHLVPF